MVKYRIIFTWFKNHGFDVICRRSYYVKANCSKRAIQRAKWNLFDDGLSIDDWNGVDEINVKRIRRVTGIYKTKKEC